MKILVPTKRVPDTDQKIRVRDDGGGVVTDTLPFVINPFCAIALEEALRMREASDQDIEVVNVGIGENYEKELRAGLAMGADRAIHVTAGGEELDPWNVARVLEKVVEREEPSLVLLGKQAVDDDSNQVGQFLAALLGWPQATFASSVTLEGGRARVERETDAGIETVTVALPAIITADLRLNEPRYASLPNIMKAKKKPVDALTCEELGVEITPRIEVLSVNAPTSTRTCQRVESVEELVHKLREEAKVL